MSDTSNNNSIPDWSTPGSKRTKPVAGDQGHRVPKGLLAPYDPTKDSNTISQFQTSLQPSSSKRKKWTTAENREVLRCYFESEPENRGYRKRFYNKWLEKNPHSTITEQRLCDQRRVIMKNKWFSSTEIGNMKRIKDNRGNPESEDLECLHRINQSPPKCRDKQETEPQVRETNLSTYQEELLTSIKNNMVPIEERTPLPSLKNVNRKKLAEHV